MSSPNRYQTIATTQSLAQTVARLHRKINATKNNSRSNDYSSSLFVDKCLLTLQAGGGGNGCVSFLREKYIDESQPNGGDGGNGGNVWIQAVRGHTSLHKLARRGIVKAQKGQGGKGKSQGGKRGEDTVIEVPVGTVVREVWRSDPTAEKEDSEESSTWVQEHGPTGKIVNIPLAKKKDRHFVVYPGSKLGDEETPPLPPPRKSNLLAMQPEAPIRLDLSVPMEQPTLLLAGGIGGLGNPHFATKSVLKPKFATRGERGVRLTLALELKLLADVGLVGLPNVGKSTLLRSISNSRTRVGNWAFTTLAPSIGTVVLDNHTGHPLIPSPQRTTSTSTSTSDLLTSFTVADIPGLIEDAHLDKGLGLGFLRHIERAGILVFVIDLSAGDAVSQLQNLWKEVGAYETLRDREVNAETQQRYESYNAFFPDPASNGNGSDATTAITNPRPPHILPPNATTTPLEPLSLPPISSKPWFVVATKADLPDTQPNYARLQQHVEKVQRGEVAHPSASATEREGEGMSESGDKGGEGDGRDKGNRMENAWRERIAAFPVSAMNGEGTRRVVEWMVGLLGR
ncbi:MAG: hypothetical protein Q9160_006282 [Pyrenula sp. 1 TL-2023]